MGTRRFKDGMDDLEYYRQLREKRLMSENEELRKEVAQLSEDRYGSARKHTRATAHVRRLTLQRRADLAEFIRVQKEQNERISELRSALAAEQQKSSTTEAFVKENAHKFADMYNEIGDLRRAEASAYAEIAQLKERVETEKTFYAYHMADAERSKKRVHDLEELNTGYLGEIAGLEDANREADALLGQCSDQIGVAVAEARRWKTACLVVSFVLVVVLLIPLVVSA